jgi:hypothetical protein
VLISIIRLGSLSDAHGTYGNILLDGVGFCCSCEQPWNNNLPDTSCIPAGTYELLPYSSPVHGETVVFHNPALGVYGEQAMIPKGKTGRFLCEIHVGNWPKDVKGCVAVGRQITVMGENGLGVNDSRNTMDQLRSKWGDRSNLRATISWDDGAPPTAVA